MSGSNCSLLSPIDFCSTTLCEAAVGWFVFGFETLPIASGTKIPACKWDPWRDRLSVNKIEDHWALFPDNEVAFIIGDCTVVLDADTPESVAALEAIERDFDVTPNLIHGTRRGVHHLLRLAPGTVAHSSCHCTQQHPERIDVKTGRSTAILPPSTAKTIRFCSVSHASELTAVGQDFIDAVFRHNGKPPPRLVPLAQRAVVDEYTPSENLVQIQALLPYLDPDMAHDDWCRVGMVIHYESGASDEGYHLFDAWSAKALKYKGSKDTDKKWKSFKLDHPTPVRIHTLKWMLKELGYDWLEILSAAEGQFEIANNTDGEEAS